MMFPRTLITAKTLCLACLLLGCSGEAPPPSISDVAAKQRTPDSAENHHENVEKIVPEAIERTIALYLVGPKDSWPVNVIISPHGETPTSTCGPVLAGYCMADNSIIFSSDFMLEATTKSSLAIPFIVGHEIAHAHITNTGVQPKSPVLRELAADCLSGKMMVNTINTDGIESEEMHADLAKFTHSIGDPNYQSINHHGFGSQRYIAYTIGKTAAILAKNGDKSHENDCVLLFAN